MTEPDTSTAFGNGIRALVSGVHRCASLTTRLMIVLLVWLGGMLPAIQATAESVPTIDSTVTDLAGVVTPSGEVALDDRIRQIHSETGVQIAVVTVRTTDGVPIEDYTLHVAETWSGGSVVRNDGMVILLAVDDRRSRMELGYDAEAWITDAEAKRILDGMSSELRRADYAAALLGAVNSVALQLMGVAPEEGGETGEPMATATSPPKRHFWLYFWILAVSCPIAFGCGLVLRRTESPYQHLNKSIGRLGLLLCAICFGISVMVIPPHLGPGLTAGMLCSAMLIALLLGYQAWAPKAWGNWLVASIALVLSGALVDWIGWYSLLVIVFGYGGQTVASLMGPKSFWKSFDQLMSSSGSSGGGSSYSSSSSYGASSGSYGSSSSSSSSSESSSGSSWSGGGGSFGGGGASSGW